MKIRKCFVSNSSSSSFIISVNSENEKVTVELDLIEFFKNVGGYGDNALRCVLKTKEDVEKYILQYSEFDTIKEFLKNDNQYYDDEKEQYHNMIEKINEGKIIFVLSVGYDQTDLFSMVVKNSKNIEVITED